MGLQQNIQKQLGVPILSIIEESIRQQSHLQISIKDVFRADRLLKLILAFTPKTIVQHNTPLITQDSNYLQVWRFLKETAQELGIQFKKIHQPSLNLLQKNLINYQQQAIQSQTWHDLNKICRLLFQIMLKNQNVLYLITKMQQKFQIQIKEYIQNNQQEINELPKQNQPSVIQKPEKKNSMTITQHINNDQKLFDRIQELERALVIKQQQVAGFKQKLSECKQQLFYSKSALHQKQSQLMILKKRLSAYAQADLLFEEKDEEITKLNSQYNDFKIKSHVKTTELNAQVAKLKQRVSELEEQKSYLSISNQQLSSKLQLQKVNKQQSEGANKKVIGNLKQKIRKLNEKIAQQQKNLMNVLMQKQQKDKQIFELEKKTSQFDPSKKMKMSIKNDDSKYTARKSSKLMDELGGDFSQIHANQDNQLKKYFQVLFGDINQRCTGQQCISLRSQFVRIVHQILAINNDQENLTYMTPENRLECMINQLNKIQETYHQNLKLKQRFILLQQSEGKGLASKQSVQQINKLKKQLLIVKRNLQQVQTKRKQELQILISVISQKFTFDMRS